MPMNGLGQALIPIIAYNYGAKKRDRIIQCLKLAYPAAAVIALIGTALFGLLGGQLLSLFSASEGMLAIGIPALRIISISFIFASVTTITGYFASGLGDGMTDMTGAFLRQFVPLLPCAWLLAKCCGVNAVWYSFLISEAAGTVFSVIQFRYLISKKGRRYQPIVGSTLRYSLSFALYIIYLNKYFTINIGETRIKVSTPHIDQVSDSAPCNRTASRLQMVHSPHYFSGPILFLGFLMFPYLSKASWHVQRNSFAG